MAVLVAVLISAVVLGATLGFAMLMHRYIAINEPPPVMATTSPAGALIEQGRHLYLMNCAHCHADDATGDEGPDLHGVRKSDARIANMIMNGVKGEMPKFGQKFNNGDVRALIAYIRSLKD